MHVGQFFALPQVVDAARCIPKITDKTMTMEHAFRKESITLLPGARAWFLITS